MSIRWFALGLWLVLLAGAFLGCSDDSGTTPDQGAEGSLVTHILSENVGRIAVRVAVPTTTRYDGGAPIVVEVSTWFVAFSGFHCVNDVTELGAISVSYLWPERGDPESGASSSGVYDYGGPRSLEVLRDVINFAAGLRADENGTYLDDLIAPTALYDNVGLWASSHAGVVATNVLAYHGPEMPGIKYLVGRENPTLPTMYPLEIGHYDDARNKVINPFYDATGYTPTTLDVDYSTIGWYQTGPEDPGRPYFAAGNGHPEHILHETICPEMWGKRYYSFEVTQALLANGALTLAGWPQDVATPDEAQIWGFRTVVGNYPDIGVGLPDLRVMLVFADFDHVQAAADKPHVHQAYDGFRKRAGLSWVRLNPDRVYVAQIEAQPPSGLPDHDANTEPADWAHSEAWGFPCLEIRRQQVWLASVAEMMDREQGDDWSVNLDQVLFDAPE